MLLMLYIFLFLISQERALRKARREHRPARGCYKADFEIPEVPPVHPSVYE